MTFEIREDRSPQGRRKLSAERAAYFRLVKQGASNDQACRIVGINPKTGRRWRNGRNASGRNKA
ncbi:helix-turn-helix domain-containing protein, partial [Streptomyces sp. NRRL S-350]